MLSSWLDLFCLVRHNDGRNQMPVMALGKRNCKQFLEYTTAKHGGVTLSSVC